MNTDDETLERKGARRELLRDLKHRQHRTRIRRMANCERGVNEKLI